jgi:hypothetical protein
VCLHQSLFWWYGTIQFTVSGVKIEATIISLEMLLTLQSANNVSETITTINVLLHNQVCTLITVTDRKTLCSDDYSITLTQPTALTIQVTLYNRKLQR